MRCVSTRVFPLPAPARMSSGPSVCSTASSWVGFRDSSNTGRKLYQQGDLDPAPKPVYEHLHLSPALLHGRAFHRDQELPRSHSLEESRRGRPARVGEEALPARCEQSRDQVREGRGVPSLVEHVGGEDEIEGPEAIELRRKPVQQRGRRLPAQVGAGVVGYEVEGGPVVVSREDFGAAVQRHYGGEPDTAPALDGAFADQVLMREIALGQSSAQYGSRSSCSKSSSSSRSSTEAGCAMR